MSGEALGAELTWDFTTRAGIHVTAVEPAADTARVSSFDPVRVTFDTPILTNTVTNGVTFKVVSTGWVDGVYYEDEPLPAGDFRVLDGPDQHSGTTIQWYPPSGPDGGMPEFGVRRDVIVTRGVQTADGAVLDEDYRFSFGSYDLDPNFYYHLSLEGLGDDKVLGVSNGDLLMVSDKTSETSQWYIVPLGDGSRFGLWNRGAGKVLVDSGSAPAEVASWTGVANMVWSLRSYGGKPGTRKPNESYRVYYLQSESGGDDLALQAGAGGVLTMKNRGGNIYSLFYLTRVGRR